MSTQFSVKVILEINSFISFATLPLAFIAVALNPGGKKRLETESAFLHHSNLKMVQKHVSTVLDDLLYFELSNPNHKDFRQYATFRDVLVVLKLFVICLKDGGQKIIRF